jgi:AcrR family transcriptional regulator
VGPADWSGLSTKRRIEQAALQLFAAEGFEATGIRDIADRPASRPRRCITT